VRAGRIATYRDQRNRRVRLMKVDDIARLMEPQPAEEGKAAAWICHAAASSPTPAGMTVGRPMIPAARAGQREEHVILGRVRTADLEPHDSLQQYNLGHQYDHHYHHNKQRDPHCDER
jgi:hypothetical protein